MKWRKIRQLAFMLCIGAMVQSSAFSDPVDPSGIRVIDGDTIAVHGYERNIRLVGFNAPEIRNAKCEDEGRLGVNATNRLKELVTAGNLDLTLVPCACKLGTQGTRACNYGRSCGVLKSGGVDVGTVLIAEGLAVPFQCGETKCPRTPRPWCK